MSNNAIDPDFGIMKTFSLWSKLGLYIKKNQPAYVNWKVVSPFGWNFDPTFHSKMPVF